MLTLCTPQSSASTSCPQRLVQAGDLISCLGTETPWRFSFSSLDGCRWEIDGALVHSTSQMVSHPNKQILKTPQMSRVHSRNPPWLYYHQEFGCSLQLITPFVRSVSNKLLTASWLQTAFLTSFTDTVQMCLTETASVALQASFLFLPCLFFKTSALTWWFISLICPLIK